MVLSRPLRALAVLSTFLLIYLTFQILSPSRPIDAPKAPEDDRHANFDRDPNLDGMCVASIPRAEANRMQKRENQKAPCGVLTTMRPTTPTRPE